MAGNLRDAAAAEAAADGAVQQALFHLAASGAPHWPAPARRTVHVGRAVVDVEVEALSGKVNPNIARLPLLRAMLALCGAPPAQAGDLALATMSWRGVSSAEDADETAVYQAAGLGYVPLGLPMQSLDEISLVRGMTPQLANCLIPHMSLFALADPDVTSDDKLVAQAVAAAIEAGYVRRGAESPGQEDSSAVRITAASRLGAARFVRRVSARSDPGATPQPFHILLWEAPTP